jgi:multiple sugar transport system substrate-binding protein
MAVNIKKSLILILVLVFSFNVFFTSCSNKEESSEADGTKTLRVIWWGSQTRADATEEVLNMYAEENGNVEFETEFSDFTGYWDKVATFAASNSLPDIIQQDYAYLKQYVTKGTMADLTPYFDDGTINTDSIDDGVLDLGKINDGNYGIALGINSQSIIYNPSLYQDAGIDEPTSGMDWEEYFSNAEKMYEKTGTQVSLPFSVDPKFFIEYWVRSAGYTFYNEEGTGLGFDDVDLLADLFEEEQRLLKTGAIYDPAKAALEKAIEESGFVKEKEAGGFAWSNFMVTYATAIEKDLGIITLPQASSGDENGMYIKPSMFFSVAESSENKDEAAKVIDYFTNNLESNKVLKADRGVPISSEVREGLKDLVDTATQQTFDYIDEATEVVGDPAGAEPEGSQEITTLALNINDEVINNKKSPKEAAEEFIKKSNEILADNK